ncbi:similar to Saccharomyces cerevisiae YDR310C SUM1 Transcriptional repressor required for mitotic repression of middle sporulation-specific genes [Maudiozyma barnettii]|nr:similar to Saccharomyces cerevisiae YDR310C SUM1 Transcriptional repressor required for mitotic repression of middle sporulation-specific genes [Kazachstania barnettii]
MKATNIGEISHITAAVNDTTTELNDIKQEVRSIQEQHEEMQALIISRDTTVNGSVKDLLDTLRTISYNQTVLENKLEDALKNQMNTDIFVNTINEKLQSLTQTVTKLQSSSVSPTVVSTRSSEPLSTTSISHSSLMTSRRGPGRPRKDLSSGRYTRDINGFQKIAPIPQNGKVSLPSGDVTIPKSKRYFTDPITNTSNNIRTRKMSKTIGSPPTRSASATPANNTSFSATAAAAARLSKSAGDVTFSSPTPKKRRGRPPKKRTVDTVIITTTNDEEEEEEEEEENNIFQKEHFGVVNPNIKVKLNLIENNDPKTVKNEIINKYDTTETSVDATPMITPLNTSRYATRSHTAKFQDPSSVVSDGNSSAEEGDNGNGSEGEENKDVDNEEGQSENVDNDGNAYKELETGTAGGVNVDSNTDEEKVDKKERASNGKQTNSELNRQQRELEKLRDPREKMLVSLKYNDRDRAKSFIKSNQKLLQAMRDEEKKRRMNSFAIENKKSNDLLMLTPKLTSNKISSAPASTRMRVLTLSSHPDNIRVGGSHVGPPINEAIMPGSDIVSRRENSSNNEPPEGSHPGKNENGTDTSVSKKISNLEPSELDEEGIKKGQGLLTTPGEVKDSNGNDYIIGPRKRGRTNSLTFKVADGSILEPVEYENNDQSKSGKKKKTMASSPPPSEASTIESKVTTPFPGTNTSMASVIPLGNRSVNESKGGKGPQDATIIHEGSSGHPAATDYQTTLLLGAPIELVCRDGFFFRRNSPKVPITTGAYLEFRFIAKEQELLKTKKGNMKKDNGKGFIVATLPKQDRSNSLSFKNVVSTETEVAFNILGKTTLTEKYVNSLEYFLMEFRWENKLIRLGLKLRESKRTWQRRKALFALFEFWRDQSRDKRGFPNYTVLHAVKEMENYRIFINRSVSWFYNHITLLKMILYDLCYKTDSQWREWMFPKDSKLPVLGDSLDDGTKITEENINEVIDNLLVFDFLDDGTMNRQVKSSQVIVPEHTK